MSALAQILLAIIGVYGFVVGLLVLGSRGMADAVIQHPLNAPEPPMPPVAAAAQNVVVQLRSDAWEPTPAQAQAS